MRYSKYNFEDGFYEYFESPGLPEINERFQSNEHGFQNFQDVQIIPQGELASKGKGKIPKGIILSSSGLKSNPDPLIELFMFAGKIWLAGKIIGRW